MAQRTESADIRAVLARAEQAPTVEDAVVRQGSQPLASTLRLRDFGDSELADRATASDSVRGDQLDLVIELGRTRMAREVALNLERGAIVELDQASGEPLDIFAGGRLIARGEVVVLDGRYCVRVTELFSVERAA